MLGQSKSALWRRIALAVWRILVVLVIFLWLHPVSYRTTRVAILALLLAIWGGSLVLWWNSKLIRIFALGISVLVICLLIFAPVISGCSGDKKGEPVPDVKSPEKKTNPRGLEHPPVPEPPPAI